jgi:hypothetical protein
VHGRWYINKRSDLGIERLHVNGNFECVRSTAQNQAAQRTYVAKVPAPGERHVAVRREKVVRGTHVNPPDSRTISRHPGVRRISTLS